MSCWSRHVRLALLVLIVPALSTCDREELPSAPDVAAQSEVDLFENGPFYYYRPAPGEPDIRIPLQLDPTELMVTAATPEAAVAALDDQELSVESLSRIPHAGLDHFRIRLQGVTRDALRNAGTALRADPRISFVGNAYTTSTSGKMVLVNRLVVKFRSGTGLLEVQALADSLGTDVLREPSATSGRPTYWLSYPEGRDPLRVAAELHTHPLVGWANADKILDIRPADHVPSDGYYDEQYYLKNSITQGGVPVDINVEDAWALTTGEGVTVAVIGTGIDGTHSEISGQRATGTCYAGWDEAFEQNDTIGDAWQPWGEYCEGGICGPYEDSHETHVAGMIAAQHNGQGTVGVAPDAELVSARILLHTESATGAQIADAIRWSWDDCGVDVVNGSFSGSTYDTDIADAISDGLGQGRSNKGTVFVFSAGNTSDRENGQIGSIGFPASVSGALAVGAIDRYGDVANYSPRGGSHPITINLDLVVPSGHTLGNCNVTPDSLAADVYAIDLYGSRGCNDSGNNYVRSFSGTSAAAPQVAGAAALVIAADPTLTGSQVRELLRDSADAWGSQPDYGEGKLNVSTALGIGPIESVTITGNSEVPPNDSCTWWANVSGGVPPYTYSWYKDGSPVGSGDNVTLNTGTDDFTLKVDVEDSLGDTDFATESITVTSSAFGCFS